MRNYSYYFNTKTRRNKALSLSEDTMSSKAAYKVHKVCRCKPLWRLLSRLLSLYLYKIFVSLCLCVQKKYKTQYLCVSVFKI